MSNFHGAFAREIFVLIDHLFIPAMVREVTRAFRLILIKLEGIYTL
jgi:hypothetical protein